MIKPGSTIGIIGGGQLGRMSAVAAAQLGYKVHIYSPEQDDPASHVAATKTVGEYTDHAKLKAFAKAVDVVTFEFENIPHESVELLESLVAVHPSSNVLKVARNRIREKTFVNDLGIGTAPFQKVTNEAEMLAALNEIGSPGILKTYELGYDGKGQWKDSEWSIKNKKGSAPGNDYALSEKFKEILKIAKEKNQDFIYEGFVDFKMEISVIVARGADGECKTYVPVHNIHKNHILDETHAPANISGNLSHQAESIAKKIAEGLKLQGLLAVEMFVTNDDKILVNELAPRPHNSGHWTIEAAVTSQFEQHIRAVCGLPLGNTDLLCKAVMKNLIGDDVNDWLQYLNEPNTKLHLYGKKEARTGRKMGHVTFLNLSSPT